MIGWFEALNLVSWLLQTTLVLAVGLLLPAVLALRQPSARLRPSST